MGELRKYPTALIGFVGGPLRLETCGGGDLIDSASPFKILFHQKPIVTVSGKTYAVTHLQKQSRCGFLLASHEKWWQLCFHLWFTFRYQQTKVGDGGAVITIPGSEKVFYWRVGWSRWDAGDCKYVVEKIGFGTWYGPGLHWD